MCAMLYCPEYQPQSILKCLIHITWNDGDACWNRATSMLTIDDVSHGDPALPPGSTAHLHTFPGHMIHFYSTLTNA